MTREEAINEIKDASDSEVRYGDIDNHYDKVMKRVEAFEMAIKALEQQLRDCKTCKHSDKGNCAGTEECHECMWESKYEQQSSEDCISREEAIRVAEQGQIQGYEWQCKKLCTLPSVTPIISKMEQVEDCISRKAVEEITWEEPSYTDALNAITEIRDKIRQLPSVTPQSKTGWIPVSERLPETDGVYLTYIVNTYDNQLSYIMICDYIHPKWFPIDETASSNVVAWMPLPEPFKESEE